MKNQTTAMLIAGVLFSGLFTGLSVSADAADAHYLLPYQAHCMANYDGSDVEHYFTMMGLQYTQGVVECDWTSGARQSLFNLDGEFTSVSFLVGSLDDNTDRSATLHIYADEELINSYSLSAGMPTTEVNLDTMGVTQLRMDFIESDSYGSFAIANITGEGGHVYDSRTLTKSPTPTEEGIFTYHCSQCGASYDEVIPSQEHCHPQLLPYSANHLAYFDHEDQDYYITVMGKKYYLGLYESEWSGENRIAMYNLGAELETVSFTVAHIDGDTDWEGTLNVYLDNAQTPYTSIPLYSTMTNTRVTIPVSGILQMKLEFADPEKYQCFALVDVDYTRTAPKDHYYTSEVITEATETINGIRTYTCVDCGFSYNEVILSEVNKARAEEQAQAAEEEAVPEEAFEEEAVPEEAPAEEAAAEDASAAAEEAKGYLNSALILIKTGNGSANGISALLTSAKACLEQTNKAAADVVNSALCLLNDTPNELNSVNVLINSALAML